MEEASNRRPDNIERFLALGGGSFDALLEMIGSAQPSEAPPMEAAPQAPGSPARLPQGYRLEYEPDAMILRREDGSFVAAFSGQGATGEAVVRAVEEGRRGLPPYCGPEQYADSTRRLVESRARYSWKRFLRAEQRALEARRNGRMAKSLAWRLPGETKEELDTIASDDRRRAKDGLVELRDEQGAFSFKHVEELSPEDRMECIRAELARIEWLLERHERRNAILRSHFFEQRQSRRSVG